MDAGPREIGGRKGAMVARASGGNESRDTLNRERVVRAAMDLADERGIASVTMRELARRLGVEAASLYNHIAGKDDLLDGMADLVVAEIDIPSEGLEWKEAMRLRAVSARDVFSRHGWAAGLIDSRGPGGPNRLSYADRVLGILLRAGFSTEVAANAFLAVDAYIYGFERQRSYLSLDDDADTTQAAREVLAAIPQGAYPSLTKVAREYAAKPVDEGAAFDFGLGLLLDGLQGFLDRTPGAPAPFATSRTPHHAS